MSIPFIFTDPEVGVSVPFKSESKVDLPAPEAPIIPIKFPLLSTRFNSCKPMFPAGKLYPNLLTTKSIRWVSSSVLYREVMSLKYTGLNFLLRILEPCAKK